MPSIFYYKWINAFFIINGLIYFNLILYIIFIIFIIEYFMMFVIFVIKYCVIKIKIIKLFFCLFIISVTIK